jgi:hypothetical protein
MSVHKLIQINADGSQEEYAGKNSSAGAGDAGEFAILDAAGKIATSMLPNGVAADSVTLTAGEALSAGDFVYISAAGTVLKADATTPAKAARGYVLAAVSNAQPATVYFDESNSSVTGLTPGATYFLSTTAGGVTTSPTTTAGQIVQELGFATSATNLHVNIQEPVTRR